MKQLRTQIEETTSDYDREKLQKLAKLGGGVAVINVGAATETGQQSLGFIAPRRGLEP